MKQNKLKAKLLLDAMTSHNDDAYELVKLMNAIATLSGKVVGQAVKVKQATTADASKALSGNSNGLLGTVTTFAGLMALVNQIRLWISEARKIAQTKAREKALSLRAQQMEINANTPKRPVGRPRKNP